MPVVSKQSSPQGGARTDRTGEADEARWQKLYPDRRALVERAMHRAAPLSELYDEHLSLMVGFHGGNASVSLEDIKQYFVERYGPRPTS